METTRSHGEEGSGEGAIVEEDILHRLGGRRIADALHDVVAAECADDHARDTLQEGEEAETPEEHAPD